MEAHSIIYLEKLFFSSCYHFATLIHHSFGMLWCVGLPNKLILDAFGALYDFFVCLFAFFGSLACFNVGTFWYCFPCSAASSGNDSTHYRRTRCSCCGHALLSNSNLRTFSSCRNTLFVFLYTHGFSNLLLCLALDVVPCIFDLPVSATAVSLSNRKHKMQMWKMRKTSAVCNIQHATQCVCE